MTKNDLEKIAVTKYDELNALCKDTAEGYVDWVMESVKIDLEHDSLHFVHKYHIDIETIMVVNRITSKTCLIQSIVAEFKARGFNDNEFKIGDCSITVYM